MNLDANTYKEFDELINKGRSPSEGRTIANNTRAERRGEDIAVRLHSTDVLLFSPDGRVTYQTGGWFSYTTKDRMNRFGVRGVTIGQRNHQWFLHPRMKRSADGTLQERTPQRFYDGIVVLEETGEPLPDPSSEPDFDSRDKENRKLEKRIKDYVAGYTQEEIASLLEGIEQGRHRGDCLFCQIGDSFGGTEHLLSHLEENYRMVSLLFQAYKKKGYVDPGLIMRIHPPQDVRRTLGGYLRGELLNKG